MSLSKPAVPRACRAVRYASNSFLSTPGAGPSKSMSTKGKDKSHHVLDYSASAFPTGFAVGSTKAGIKKSGALDLGVLISTSSQPCSAAACLTRNAFKAAPVTVTSELLRTYNGKARGVVVNSGCANAVTGKKGLEDAWSMSNTVTGLLGEDAESGGTLVMSTGVIGQHLPIDSITSAIPPIVSRVESSPSGWLNLARAFMTTDTFPKLRTMSYDSAGKTVKFVGIDKGAGMIAPSMGPPHATLLGVIATDAAVEPKALQSALQYAVDRSFNAITVDGDMSTNDTIIALANGASGAEIIKEGSTEFEGFRDELKKLAEELAQLVVRDGEGATKFVTVRVKVNPRPAPRHLYKLVTNQCAGGVVFRGCGRRRQINLDLFTRQNCHVWGR